MLIFSTSHITLQVNASEIQFTKWSGKNKTLFSMREKQHPRWLDGFQTSKSMISWYILYIYYVISMYIKCLHVYNILTCCINLTMPEEKDTIPPVSQPVFFPNQRHDSQKSPVVSLATYFLLDVETDPELPKSVATQICCLSAATQNAFTTVLAGCGLTFTSLETSALE